MSLGADEVEPGAFFTLLTVFAVAIVCGLVTYRVSMREVKREIAEAMQEHIEKLHADHREFVERVVQPAKRLKE